MATELLAFQPDDEGELQPGPVRRPPEAAPARRIGDNVAAKVGADIRVRIEPFAAHASLVGGRHLKRRRLLAELRAGPSIRDITVEDVALRWVGEHPQYEFVVALTGFLRKPDVANVVDLAALTRAVPPSAQDQRDQLFAYIAENERAEDQARDEFVRDYAALQRLMDELERYVVSDGFAVRATRLLADYEQADRRLAELDMANADVHIIGALAEAASRTGTGQFEEGFVDALGKEVGGLTLERMFGLFHPGSAGAYMDPTYNQARLIADLKDMYSEPYRVADENQVPYQAFLRQRDAIREDVAQYARAMRDLIRSIRERDPDAIVAEAQLAPDKGRDKMEAAAATVQALRDWERGRFGDVSDRAATAQHLAGELQRERDDMDQIREMIDEARAQARAEVDAIAPPADFATRPLPLQGQFTYAAQMTLGHMLRNDASAAGSPAESGRALFAFTTHPATRAPFVALMSAYLLQARRSAPEAWIPLAAGASTGAATMAAIGVLGRYRYSGGVVRLVTR